MQDKTAAVTYGRSSVDTELQLLATFLNSTSYILPRLGNYLQRHFSFLAHSLKPLGSKWTRNAPRRPGLLSNIRSFSIATESCPRALLSKLPRRKASITIMKRVYCEGQAVSQTINFLVYYSCLCSWFFFLFFITDTKLVGSLYLTLLKGHKGLVWYFFFSWLDSHLFNEKAFVVCRGNEGQCLLSRIWHSSYRADMLVWIKVECTHLLKYFKLYH